MPRRTGMRDDDIMARLHDAERRLDWLEALPEAVKAVEDAKTARAEARAERQAEKDAPANEPAPAVDAPSSPPFVLSSTPPPAPPKADKGK